MDTLVRSCDNKNWEVDFYQINYFGLDENANSELLKEYINRENEKESGQIFRSTEAEPESLKIFMTSTIQNIQNMTVPTVVTKGPFEYKKRKQLETRESLLSDITRYYEVDEENADNRFISKLKIIISHLGKCEGIYLIENPGHPVTAFLNSFEKQFWLEYSRFLEMTKYSPQEAFELFSQDIETAKGRAVRDAKNMIYCISLILISIYKLNSETTNLEFDLLLNLVTR